MWTTGLEATPKGTELGSSSSYALRLIKTEFEILLSKEHTFVSTATPLMRHLEGDCSVCGLSEGSPTPLNIAGSIWWDYTNKRFYRDAGGGFGVGNPMVSLVHGDLDNRDSDTAHTNYIMIDLSEGDTFQDLTVPKLEGLDTVPGNYSSTTDPTVILSQAAHLDSPVTHDAQSITVSSFDGFELGIDKIKTKETVIINGSIGTGVSGEYIIPRYSFMPYFKPGTSIGVAFVYVPKAVFPPPSDEVDYTDYVGGFRLYVVQGGTAHFAVRSLDV
jgi:hypothetical protein